MKSADSEGLSPEEMILLEADNHLMNKSFSKAIELYKTLINSDNIKQDSEIYFHILYSLGAAYIALSDLSNNQKNWISAIEMYEEAIKVMPKEKDIIKYADVKKQLGHAYLKLSEIVCTEESLRKAVNAYEESYNALAINSD